MFSTCVSELHGIRADGLSRRELVDLMENVRRLKGATAALEARVTAAINSLRDDGLDGAGVLRVVGRMSGGAAARVSATADQLEEMPLTAAALATGRITQAHAESIASAAEAVSPCAADEALAVQAAVSPADVFARDCRDWAAKNRLDDGSLLRERQRADRSVADWISRDGMFNLRARLDPVAGAAFKAKLDQRTNRLWKDDGGRDGSPDAIRTFEQRKADALCDLVASEADSGPVHPKHQVLVVADVSRCRGDDPSGSAEIIGTGAVPQPVLERLACDAGITGVLFDGPGKPIHVGRTHRSATPAQWRALIARDRGCVGCAASINRCEAHHIVAWQANGPTDITNLVLLCSRCHHDVHDRGLNLTFTDGRWNLQPRDGPVVAAASAA